MKKLCLLILLLTAIYVFLPQKTYAEEQVTFDDILSSLIDAIDSDDLNADLDEFWNSSDAQISFKEKLLSVLSGDFSLNYSNVFSALFGLLLGGVRSLLPSVISICLIALFYAIVRSVNPNFLNDGIGQVLYFACYAAILGLVIFKAFNVLNNCFFSIERYATQMDVLFPVIITVMSATGATVSASVYQPAVAFLGTGITGVICKFVLPLVVLLLIFSSVSGLSSVFKIEKISNFISSVIKWILGICITVFTMFMSIQGMTAGMYDGITLRVTKYAIGNSVPIVGGFLRDGVDLFLAAGLLVKNALGLFGVVFIVGIFLSPIVELITFMFFLKLSAGLIEPFTNSKISDYMFSIAKNLNYVLASVLVVCFMYLVTIILIICAGGAMV